MEIVQVAPYAAHPQRLGGDHRTHGLVKELPGLGHEVTRFCQGGTPHTYRTLDLRRDVEVADGYTEHRHLHPVHEIPKAPMLAGYPNTHQSAALRLASGRLDAMLESADAVVLREPWQARYVYENTPSDTPVALSCHNVEAERFGYAAGLPLGGRALRRVTEQERHAVENADALVVTSERDLGEFRGRYSTPDRTLVAPNGTYAACIRGPDDVPRNANRARGRYGFTEDNLLAVFMGSAYRPNIEAARWVCDLAENMPDARFLIVGSVCDHVDDAPWNVSLAGYIEDEDDFEASLAAADVALNPMDEGGGTNIKMMDYMARGLPVVTTPFGVRGTGFEHGEHVVVAERDGFPGALRGLYYDDEKSERIAGNARELVESRYTWERSSRVLAGLLEDLARGKA